MKIKLTNLWAVQLLSSPFSFLLSSFTLPPFFSIFLFFIVCRSNYTNDHSVSTSKFNNREVIDFRDNGNHHLTIIFIFLFKFEFEFEMSLSSLKAVGVRSEEPVPLENNISVRNNIMKNVDKYMTV